MRQIDIRNLTQFPQTRGAAANLVSAETGRRGLRQPLAVRRSTCVLTPLDTSERRFHMGSR